MKSLFIKSFLDKRKHQKSGVFFVFLYIFRLILDIIKINQYGVILMDKILEFMNSNFIYNQTWLQFKRYSSTCYKLNLEMGMYVIIDEKEDYQTMKTDYLVTIYIESGFEMYKIHHFELDKKRLKYVSVDEYLLNLSKGGKRK